VRTVPVPTWVKVAVDRWLTAAGISTGPVFRAINKSKRIGTSGFSPKVIWGVVKTGSSKCGLDRVAPHDLRRTCARRVMRQAGHLNKFSSCSVTSASRQQNGTSAASNNSEMRVNDKIGLEPAGS
jgi:integrase